VSGALPLFAADVDTSLGGVDGEGLRVFRQMRGLSQRQLASRLRVSDTTVSAWERGGSIPLWVGPRIRQLAADGIPDERRTEMESSTAAAYEQPGGPLVVLQGPDAAAAAGEVRRALDVLLGYRRWGHEVVRRGVVEIGAREKHEALAHGAERAAVALLAIVGPGEA